MKDYFEMVAALPLPMVKQCDAFAHYVTWAHSWYKHLPLFPPGTAFVFYLDPSAGFALDHVADKEARILVVGNPLGMPEFPRVVLREIKDWRECWHYNMLPTAAYRARFGFWRYEVLNWDVQSKTYTRPQIYVAEERRCIAVPDEVIQQCSCRLTAFVHERGQYYPAPSDDFREKLSELEALAQERGDTPQQKRFRSLLPLFIEEGQTRCLPCTRLKKMYRFDRKDGHIVGYSQVGLELTERERRIETLILEEQAYEQNCVKETLRRTREYFAQRRG